MRQFEPVTEALWLH